MFFDKLFKAKKLPLFLIAPLLVVVGYYPMISGFFQQDEWLAFGRHFQLQNESLGTLLFNIFVSPGGHYNPLNFAVIHFLFWIFQINYIPYAIISIILQVIVVMLVFYLAKLIFNESRLAVLTSLTFAVMASDYQATSWTVADVSIHGSAIFAILSLIYCFLLIKYNKTKFLLFSLGSLVVSFLFKEIALAYFIILPLVIYLFSRSFGKDEIRYIKIIFLTGFLLIVIRVIIGLTGSTNFSFSQNFLYNFLTVPITSVSQTLLPQEQFHNLIVNTNLQILKYFRLDITDNDLLARGEKIVTITSYLLISISIFILAALIAIFNKRNSNYLVKASLFGLLFIILNSFVFVLSPERTDKMIIIDSRNLYLPALGLAIYLTSIASILSRKRFLVIPIFILFIVLNIYWLYHINSNLKLQGEERKSILTNIKSSYPSLPKKVVFYTESDTSFYGLSPKERILPFQSGFGQTLLIWYQSSEKLPNAFLLNKFLWGITDQGYKQSLPSGEGKEMEDRGFGYYRDFNLLAKDVTEHAISVNSVIAYRYGSEDRAVTDISAEVKGRLLGYLASRNEKKLDNIQIQASENSSDVGLMMDKNRTTFWDSKKPYKTEQTLDINLGDNKRVSHIKIDSYNNKDQNNVGYEVLTSDDRKVWKTVFYSKRFPPTDDGIVNLYIPPTSTNFIRIKQIGAHDFASWVIYELSIFEPAT